MNWAIGIDIYTLIRVKWISNKNLLYKNINKIQKLKKKKKKKDARSPALSILSVTYVLLLPLPFAMGTQPLVLPQANPATVFLCLYNSQYQIPSTNVDLTQDFVREAEEVVYVALQIAFHSKILGYLLILSSWTCSHLPSRLLTISSRFICGAI